MTLLEWQILGIVMSAVGFLAGFFLGSVRAHEQIADSYREGYAPGSHPTPDEAAQARRLSLTTGKGEQDDA